ncbi:MAG: ComEC/Rec2 family competence protein [Paracoccus sp. (in: a-proteobacteria)]|nr:ComEC/Rec2 family competence protein [Paracoccus sp. (in: a-proteobacteria)]
MTPALAGPLRARGDAWLAGLRGRLRDGLRLPEPRARARTRRRASLQAGLVPWLPIWMGCGIALWFWLPQDPGAAGYVLASVAAACGIALFLWPHALLPDLVRIAGMALAVMAAAFALSGVRAHLVAAPVLEWRYYGPIEGRVVELDRSGRDRLRIVLDQVRLGTYGPHETPRKVRLSLMSDQTPPEPGARVMLTGHLGPPPGPAEPGGFDFRRQAYFQGLGAVGYVRTPIMRAGETDPGRLMALHRLRMAMSQAMQDHIPGQPGAVAAALITGDRSAISPHSHEVMRGSNLSHLIAISGLHMSIVTGFVFAALRFLLIGAEAAALWRGRAFLWPGRKIAAVGALLAAALYLVVSGASLATERAFIMVSVMLCAILADRRAISLRSIAVAAVIILAMAPEALFSPGFQMSFAATAALILSVQPWGRVSPYIPALLRPFAMLLVSSLIAGLATAPIAAAHFSRMAQYGLLANMLVVPAMGSFIMPAGVIAALVAPLGLSWLPLWVMGWGCWWILMIGEWVSGLRGAVTPIPAAPAFVLGLMVLGTAALVLSPPGGWRRALRWRLALGAALLGAGFAVWIAAPRPALLIAPEGDAAALMSAAGRVPSKPRGGSFAVSRWLLDDGDLADQEQAAARDLWQGESRARSAYWAEAGLTVTHLTGRGAADAAPAHCRAGTLLIVAEEVGGKPGPCLLFDTGRLAQTGAIALDWRGGALVMRTETALSSGRAWGRVSEPRAAQ